MMKTLHKTQEFLTSKRVWHVIDAKGKVLGRTATQIAMLLMGKTKSYWSAHLDCGDFVIVTNAGKVKFTGDKINQKEYFKHSGYPKGAKIIPLKTLMEKKPEEVIFLAVKRMLPKNTLADRMLRRLKIYRDTEHPHAVQNPTPYEIASKY